MKAYVCDKCGRVITNKKIMEDMRKINISTDNVGIFGEWHLCFECFAKLEKFIHESDD
jgi:hypothetical protein